MHQNFFGGQCKGYLRLSSLVQRWADRTGHIIQQFFHAIQASQPTTHSGSQHHLGSFPYRDLQQRIKEHPVFVFVVIVTLSWNVVQFAAQWARHQGLHTRPIKISIRSDLHGFGLLSGSHHDFEIPKIVRREHAIASHSEGDGHGPLRAPQRGFQLKDGASLKVDIKISVVGMACASAWSYIGIVAPVLIDQNSLLGESFDARLKTDIFLYQ